MVKATPNQLENFVSIISGKGYKTSVDLREQIALLKRISAKCFIASTNIVSDSNRHVERRS